MSTRAIDEVLEATNRRFARVRHPRAAGDDDAALTPAAQASRESVAYINAFWPHVIAALAADPERLGLCATVVRDGAAQVVRASELRAAMLADPSIVASPAEKLRRGTVLAALAVMSQNLNHATAQWAADLTALPRRCPLDYLLDARRFVSLRMLLPLRDGQADRVGGNAPTLVMGGTATALTMCWNLLAQMPRAWQALTGGALGAADAERVWADTRELVFRIGGGSLAAFVALASACSSQAGAMIWDRAGELGLERRDGRYAWTMTAALNDYYDAMLETVADAQQGHYVGCAALYARAPALPLAARWADAVDTSRDQQVLAELLRWITAVARAWYFPLFDVADGTR
ncbi:MAG: hypothetical protein RLW62_15220 [Gammaproteobacteria bacterium]